MPSSAFQIDGFYSWTWEETQTVFGGLFEGYIKVLDVSVLRMRKKSRFRHPVRDNQHLNTALMTRYIEQIKQARYDKSFY